MTSELARKMAEAVDAVTGATEPPNGEWPTLESVCAKVAVAHYAELVAAALEVVVSTDQDGMGIGSVSPTLDSLANLAAALDDIVEADQ